MDYSDLFLDPNAPIEQWQDLLPHWFQAGKLHFVTTHLADSLPAEVRRTIETEIELFKNTHPEPWSAETTLEFHKRFTRRKLDLLDAGYGSCLLRQPSLRNIVDDTLLFHNHKKYFAFDYVIMPNHLHMLAVFFEDPEKTMKGVNRYTARQINKMTGKKGDFWDSVVFDRLIRSEKHLAYTRNYIRENPRFLPPSDFTLRSFI